MTQEPFSIHLIRESDVADWFRLRRALWDGVSDEEHRAEMSEILAHPETQLILVAEDGRGKLVGFLEASIRPFVEDCHSDHVGYLEGWFVEKHVRRFGIGRKLVEAAETWAIEHGCAEMASDSELGNELSVAAHSKLGYAETSRLVHWRKEL